MTNNIRKLAVAGLACVALVGTTFAAPHGGHGGGHAPRVAAPNGHPAAGGYPAPAPTHHCAPEPHPAPPPPAPHHHGGHDGGDRGGWIMAGAAAVGGLVGGLIGACR